MKKVNRNSKKYIYIFSALVIYLCSFLCGCKDEEIALPYGYFDNNADFSIDAKMTSNRASFFAENLCASDVDILDNSTIDPNGIYAAGVYDLNNKEVKYSYNATVKLNPASLTKVMTALIILEKCELTDMVTIGDITIQESGSQLFNLKQGDTISVQNLLYAMLVYSGNDAAVALSQYISGSEEEFTKLMNEKAQSLGCTGTHFANSNGLTNEEHYTTVYDLYIIFNEALKYDIFKEIISTSSIDISYTNINNEIVNRTVNTTNKFLTGEYTNPDAVSIQGGKTGSTNAAGKCLMLYSYDKENNPYISVILGAGDEQTLYNYMKTLLQQVVAGKDE